MSPDFIAFTFGVVVGAAIAGIAFGFSYGGFVLRVGGHRHTGEQS